MSSKNLDITVSNDKKREIWADIISVEFASGNKEEGEITAEEFAEMNNVSVSYARKKLSDLVKSGKVTKRYFADGRYRRVLLYLPVRNER